MDPVEAFRCWDVRMAAAAAALMAAPPPRGGLEELFRDYGVRYQTVEKIGELGFTVSTLVAMKEEELEDMIAALCHVLRWDLLVGERFGIKAAVRTERRRRHLDVVPLAAEEHEGFSQEGLSEEIAAAASVGEPCETHKKKKKKNNKKSEEEEEEEEGEEDRQREHPFIVTEPGELARGKKNGLDYLFHLYELCRGFLVQVQAMARERGQKCPTKVTNQVFRFAKDAGASYINKPKMRHYVHCYALHCLDEEASNGLRRAFKERGENVGAWRQACYAPLVEMAGKRHGWDVDAMFASQARLAIWYVPTRLRQLCHAARGGGAGEERPLRLAGGDSVGF
ncbi:floral meristem identity control protein LEAFY [Wolffia australiana]